MSHQTKTSWRVDRLFWEPSKVGLRGFSKAQNQREVISEESVRFAVPQSNDWGPQGHPPRVDHNGPITTTCGPPNPKSVSNSHSGLAWKVTWVMLASLFLGPLFCQDKRFFLGSKSPSPPSLRNFAYKFQNTLFACFFFRGRRPLHRCTV